jgi:uncharacterized protein YbjT (DUF2867 family)
MKAIIIGATGLTGSYLLKQMQEDSRLNEILVFGRKSAGSDHPKVTEYIINFDNSWQWQKQVNGDILFLCLGTTRRKAGGKMKQYQVDYYYQYEFARIARYNGVKTCVLVSARGASAKSLFFYMRMKGQLENAIKGLDFSKLHIMRPNILDGDRKEKRFMEKMSLKIIKFLNTLGLFRLMKPTHVNDLAGEMIEIVFQENTLKLS